MQLTFNIFKNPTSPPKHKEKVNRHTLAHVVCAKGYTDIKNGTVHVVSLHLCWGREQDRKVLKTVYKTHRCSFLQSIGRHCCASRQQITHVSACFTKQKKKKHDKKKKNWKKNFSRFWLRRKFSVWTRMRRRNQSFPLAARKTKPSGLCSQNTAEREWTPQCPAEGGRKRQPSKCWVQQINEISVQLETKTDRHI